MFGNIAGHEIFTVIFLAPFECSCLHLSAYEIYYKWSDKVRPLEFLGSKEFISCQNFPDQTVQIFENYAISDLFRFLQKITKICQFDSFFIPFFQ